MSLSEFRRRFPDDDACLEFLKERRYPAGTPCPSCGKPSRFHRISGRSAYSCQYCGHHVYPTAGTIFHRSRTRLQLWFSAIELARSEGAALTARRLENEIDVSTKTALRMLRQIRTLLEQDPDPLGTGEASVRTLPSRRPRARGHASPPGREMRRMTRRVKLSVIVVALLGAIAASLLLGVSDSGPTASRAPMRSLLMRLKNSAAPGRSEALARTAVSGTPNNKIPGGREGAGGDEYTWAQEDYDNRAFPATRIAYAQVLAAQKAAVRIATKKSKPKGGGGKWEYKGPDGLQVHPLGTQTYGAPTEWSGRVTALALGPCTSGKKCTLYVGAAGGGVWKTKNANDTNPSWSQITGDQIPSNSIGSIVVDPSDPSGNTIYVGTGEPNGSGDSEAGVGLYKSTNGGKTWFVVPGSVGVSKDRAIGAIAIDPNDPQHILIGTDVARHGSSAHNGGRFTPPGAPAVGLYESFDGGTTFSLTFSQTADTVDPSSPTGSDYFLGGVTKIQYDPNEEGVFYFSMFGYGLFRFVPNMAAPVSGKSLGTFENIFYDDESAGAEPQDVVRFEFKAVDATGCLASTSKCPGAPLKKSKLLKVGPKDGLGCTLIYLGAGWNEGGPHGAQRLYATSCVNEETAASLTTGGTNGGWDDLSSDDPTDPGFGSYDFCQIQCSYDMIVETPPGRPWDVFLGGAMQYGELPTFGGFSNGRAIVQSTDWGVHWNDMTGDFTPRSGAFFFPYEDMHPDQHAIVFNPDNPDLFYVGSDGGVIRSNGTYSDASSDCVDNPFRGLSDPYLTDCEQFLSMVPTKLMPMNKGLGTLQFQNLSVDPKNPGGSVLGGTQDNGSPAYNGSMEWFLGVTGDGGDSGTDAKNPNIKFHSYYALYFGDTNFHGVNPLDWVWTADPLVFAVSGGEGVSFYPPQIEDPVVSGRRFAGTNHVWRTNDNGGDQSFLEAYCNTVFGTLLFTGDCGDWEELGTQGLDSSYYGSDKLADDPADNYVVRLTRATDKKTLWAGLRRGRVFISKNADAANPADVTFYRIDGPDEPERFVSGIYVDPSNPFHAWVTYSGYNAYADDAGTAEGHVFSVTVDPNSCYGTTCSAATWTNLDYDLDDQPILDDAWDQCGKTLYVATDWGVLRLDPGATSWVTAASGMPPVAVYSLTLGMGKTQYLWAGTHGRGAYRLTLPGKNCAPATP